jgi:LEA14-like dessication related protein
MTRRALTAVLALVALASCAPALKPPSVRLENLKIQRVSLTGMDMLVEFKLRNTNPTDLDIERFEYDMWLNDHHLGSGYYTEALHLAAFAETTVVSKFELGFLTLPGTIKAIVEEKLVHARVKGTFHARGPVRRSRLGFEHEADVPLDRQR